MDGRTKTVVDVTMDNDQVRLGDKALPFILDQYKLCVEMADRMSARRVLTNNSFITMMGAGAFIYSAAPQYLKEGNNTATYFQLGIAFGCVVLAVMWYATI